MGWIVKWISEPNGRFGQHPSQVFLDTQPLNVESLCCGTCARDEPHVLIRTVIDPSRSQSLAQGHIRARRREPRRERARQLAVGVL